VPLPSGAQGSGVGLGKRRSERQRLKQLKRADVSFLRCARLGSRKTLVSIIKSPAHVLCRDPKADTIRLGKHADIQGVKKCYLNVTVLYDKRAQPCHEVRFNSVR
jgi:hypothetical protein